MLRNILSSLAVGLLVAACNSPSPATSSSSHWVTCGVVGDCSAVPNAAACKTGYCVDGDGNRIRQSDSTGSGGATGTDGGTGGAVANGGTGGAGASSACDPLTPHPLSVTLGTILGVGKDPGGTTYLADEVTTPSTIDRVFVSEGSTLTRKRVSGTGSSGVSGGTDYTFSFDSGTGVEALLISRRGSMTTAMGLGPANGKGFLGDPGAVTTMLTVEDPSTVSRFTLKNLPGDVAIEYVADVDDGSVIVVTHPADDYTYTDFRLFWGPAGIVAERKVDDVTRTRSGDTDIVFEVGPALGDTVTAHFTYVLEPSADGGIINHAGPGTLMGKGVDTSFTERRPVPTTLTGLSFTCL